MLLIAFAALTATWLWRREMTPPRALGLLGATILLWLVSEKDFLDNPFSPIFQFAGVSILVFALVWSLISAGKYANATTRSFPQPARLLIYLGYILISVVTIHWFNAIHEVWLLAAQSGWTNEGFVAYGMSIVYLTLVEGGQRLREPSSQQVANQYPAGAL